MTGFIIIYVTFPNEEEARKISKTLIEKDLIACANFFPIKSMYKWEGKMQHDEEIVSIMKTATLNHAKLEEEIRKTHSYECPCIMKIDVSANKEYEDWVNKTLLN